MTQAATFTSVSAGLSFIRQLLLAFLLGFAMAAAVALFVFPTTSRSNIWQRVRTYPQAVNPILKAEISYIKGSESEGPWRLTRLATMRTRTYSFGGREQKEALGSTLGAQGLALKEAVDKLTSIHSSAHGQLYYAKQEIAFGKLTGENLEEFFLRLRAAYLPLAGIGMLPVVFRRLTRVKVPSREDGPYSVGRESSDAEYPLEIQTTQPNHFVLPLCERLQAAARLVNQGLQHTWIRLELAKPKDFREPRKRRKSSAPWPNDEESTGDHTVPGSPDFLSYFERQKQEYFERRRQLPETWASLNAFAFPDGDHKYEENFVRKEFFAVLFIGHLHDLLLQATSELVEFADRKVVDGTMQKQRLIIPKMELLKQWMLSNDSRDVEDEQDGQPASEDSMDDHHGRGIIDPLKVRSADAGRLSPATRWEKFGNGLRWISHACGSEQSGFGFRVAIASFSAAILAYLPQTQSFFFANRVVWVVIIIVIGMTPTSGTFVFGLLGRIVGTALATTLAFVVWYIAVGRTPGVIVFGYVGNCIIVCPVQAIGWCMPC